jgi:hypothetical protein
MAEQNNILTILIERFLYTTRSTVGKMYFEYVKDFVQFPLVWTKEYFCYTLEDTVRPSGIKIYGETALTGGLVCDVSLFENDHYGKTIIFHTEEDKITILIDGVKWTSCLAHNGATFEHTEGCVLVGAKLNPPLYQGNYITKEPFVYDPMKETLRKKIDNFLSKGYIMKVKFMNLRQPTNILKFNP